MKSIFNLFRRNTQSSVEVETAANPTPSSADAPKVQFNVGDTSAEFIPHSKTSLILAGLLIVALAAFGYRFLTSKSNSAPAITVMGKAQPAKTPVEQKDPVQTARQLFENSQIDDSIAVYQDILKKTPKDAQVLNDLGVLYLKKQKFEESEAQLKRSIEIAPDCAVCLNNLGYLKTLQGETVKAESYLKKAIALNSDYIDPYFNLGVLYEKNGDISRSASAYREFLHRSKEQNSQFNFNLEQHLHSILEK